MGFPLALLGLLLGDLWALVMVPPIPAPCLFQSIQAWGDWTLSPAFPCPSFIGAASANASVTEIFLQAQPLQYHPQPPPPAQGWYPHSSQTSVVPDAPPVPFSCSFNHIYQAPMRGQSLRGYPQSYYMISILLCTE